MTDTSATRPYSVATSAYTGLTLTEIDLEDLQVGDYARDIFDPEHPLNLAASPNERFTSRARLAGCADPVAVLDLLKASIAQAQRLRHAHYIKAPDAIQWIGNMIIREPERISWHIARLNGVSPSSAWAYVAEARGQRYHFTTGRELDMTRLMRLLPSASTWHSDRGTHLEELNRRIMMLRYGHEFTRDVESHQAITAVNGTAKLPWLVGNPDEVATINSRPGARAIIDYKVPNQVKTEDDDPMEYQVQLHLYRMKSIAAQRPANFMYISHLNVAEDIARMWTLQVATNPADIDQVFYQARMLLRDKSSLITHAMAPIALDLDLEQEIITACSAADERVLSGRIAPWPRKVAAEVTPAQLERAQTIESQLSVALALEDALKERVSELKSEIKETLRDVPLKGTTPICPLLSLVEDNTFVVSAANEHLQNLGIDTSELVKTKVDLDPAKVKAKLTELEIPLDRFSTKGLKVGLSKAKAGHVFNHLNFLSENSERVVKEWIPEPSLPEAARPSQPPSPDTKVDLETGEIVVSERPGASS